MLSLDEQCKRDRGTNACFVSCFKTLFVEYILSDDIDFHFSHLHIQKDARVCAQLFCFDSASGYCVSYRPAAEGSSCGDGQVCTIHFNYMLHLIDLLFSSILIIHIDMP